MSVRERESEREKERDRERKNERTNQKRANILLLMLTQSQMFLTPR